MLGSAGILLIVLHTGAPSSLQRALFYCLAIVLLLTFQLFRLQHG